MNEAQEDRPVLDAQALERLKEWGGESLIRKMAALFVENAPARLEQIRQGLSPGQAEEAERGAHSLKSSSANLGAMRLRDVVARMELDASEGRMAEVELAIPDLEREYDAAVTALKAVADGGDLPSVDRGGD